MPEEFQPYTNVFLKMIRGCPEYDVRDSPLYRISDLFTPSAHPCPQQDHGGRFRNWAAGHTLCQRSIKESDHRLIEVLFFTIVIGEQKKKISSFFQSAPKHIFR
jgi:hypothetical protein